MRSTPVLLAFTLVASAAVASGCLTATDSSVRVTPYVGIVNAEPGRPVDVTVLVENLGPFKDAFPVSVGGLPTNWTFEAESNGTVSLNGGAARPVIVTVTPAADAAHGPQMLRVSAGGGGADVVVKVTDLGAEPAREGVGAQVFTVGFWDNGTVFYTNMKEVRDNAGLPRTRLDPDADADENMAAIKAYVGGERGEPVPEPYNSSGYVTLIPGFDERMRTGNGGMRAGETLAVRIPPEKAYTIPGREDHALYGDPINFVIVMLSVDVLEREIAVPCPPQSPVCPAGVEPPR